MADLRKEELFPADAFGLFYLHQPALRGLADYRPLAEQFFVSKYHLMHEFSQKTGTSVYRYLMQQRLHAVCELLEQGTVPNEAYLLCGFKDYANFYRAFRSAYG